MQIDTLLGHSEQLKAVWDYLQGLANDRHNPARVFSLASVDQQGDPQLRSLILREVSPWLITAYTDSRSPKVGELQAHTRAKLLFWDAHRRWQLRCSAQTNVMFAGERVDNVWSGIAGTASAQDYLTQQPPGAEIDKTIHYADTPALALLDFKIESIDWLQLSRDGHTRWRLTPEEMQALVP